MARCITRKEMAKIDMKRFPSLTQKSITVVNIIQEVYRYELRPINESKYFKDAWFFCRDYDDAYNLAQEQANKTGSDWTVYDSHNQDWTTIEPETEVQYAAAG